MTIRFVVRKSWGAFAVALLVLVASGSAVAGRSVITSDVPGSADHPELGRIPGALIAKYVHKQFGSVTYPTAIDIKAIESTDKYSGEIWKIDYFLPEAVGAEGAAMVYRRNLEEKGFEILLEHEDPKGWAVASSKGRARIREDLPPLSRPVFVLVGKGVLQGREALVVVYSFKQGTTWGDRYWAYVRIVESQPLDTALEVVGAEKMAAEIGAAGHVALYGITFDHDSDRLKPDSAGTLSEIAKYMNSDPEVRLFVVGHTDNTGGYEYNIDLSKRRAEAVVRALVESHGIAPERLKGVGVGPVAPVATNATDDGRAKNRRVELVMQ